MCAIVEQPNLIEPEALGRVPRLLLSHGGHLAFWPHIALPSPPPSSLMSCEDVGVLLLVDVVGGGLLLHVPGPARGEAHGLDEEVVDGVCDVLGLGPGGGRGRSGGEH